MTPIISSFPRVRLVPKTPPTFAASNTWDKITSLLGTNYPRKQIKTIKIVDSYTPYGTEKTSWDASALQDGSLKAYISSGGTTLTIAGNGTGKIYAHPNSLYMFTGDIGYADYFGNVTQIRGLELLDTSNVTNMAHMFDSCSSVTSFNLGGFCTSKVTNMFRMFYGCTSAKVIDVSSFDTANVTNMESMFYSCQKLVNLDLSGFSTKSITSSSNLRRFAQLTTNLTTLTLNDDFVQSRKLPSAGSNSGLFYDISATSIIVYHANDVMKAYDWAADNREVTFVD